MGAMLEGRQETPAGRRKGRRKIKKTAGEGAGKSKNAGRAQAKKRFYFPRRRGAGKLKIPQAVRRKIEIPAGGAQKKYFRRQ